MGRTRAGFRIGRSGWISFGRSGPRVGGKIGPVRVSTGRSGTRVGAGRNGLFVTRWIPAARRSGRPPARRTRPSSIGTGLVVFAIFMLLVIGTSGHMH
jgi:hypothetical protein